jgi:hypothetical protein
MEKSKLPAQFDKPITQIMRQRFSCRTYLKRPLAEGTRLRLADFVAASRVGPFGGPARFELAAATEDDSSQLRGLGTYGLIRGARAFILGAVPDGEAHLEDFGYLMERIILFATDLGLGTCWLGGTFQKSNFARKMALKQGESLPAVTSVGYIAERRGWRDRLIRRGAGAHARLPWERLFFDGDLGRPLARAEAGPYAEPLEMVRLGPSASNKQPWRLVRDGTAWHFYLQRTPGYRRSTGGLFQLADMQRLDMGIACCHFELAARELGLPGEWRRQPSDLPRLPQDPAAPEIEYTATWLAHQAG